jgi:hypothetical protein
MSSKEPFYGSCNCHQSKLITANIKYYFKYEVKYLDMNEKHHISMPCTDKETQNQVTQAIRNYHNKVLGNILGSIKRLQEIELRLGAVACVYNPSYLRDRDGSTAI